MENIHILILKSKKSNRKVHDEVIAKTFTGINHSFVFVFAWPWIQNFIYVSYFAVFFYYAIWMTSFVLKSHFIFVSYLNLRNVLV